MLTRCLLLVPFAIALGACNNECDFMERCNGNAREVCGDAADQVAGRKIHSTPCSAPDDTCIEVDAQTALCVRPPATSCDDTFVSACDQEVRTLCSSKIYADPVTYPTRFVISEDCAKAGKTCAPDGAAAVCK